MAGRLREAFRGNSGSDEQLPTLDNCMLRGYVKGGQEVKALNLSSKSWRLTSYSKDAATNPRGIPYAPFVDKVEDYVSSRAEVDGTMKSFQEMISYGFWRPQASSGLLIRLPWPESIISWKSIPRDGKLA